MPAFFSVELHSQGYIYINSKEKLTIEIAYDIGYDPPNSRESLKKEVQSQLNVTAGEES